MEQRDGDAFCVSSPTNSSQQLLLQGPMRSRNSQVLGLFLKAKELGQILYIQVLKIKIQPKNLVPNYISIMMPLAIMIENY